MKKLVIIAVVLMVAGVAGASTTGTGFAASKTSVLAGETITVSLVSTSPVSGFSIDAISDGGVAGHASSIAFGPGMTAMSPGYYENTSAGVLIDFIGAATSGPVPTGSLLFSFLYTVPTSVAPGNLITIGALPYGTTFWSRLDEVWYTVYAPQGVGGPEGPAVDPVTLTVVPEPMTLAILGFGGLLLRRRN